MARLGAPAIVGDDGTVPSPEEPLLSLMTAAGIGRGAAVALVAAPEVGVAMATADGFSWAGGPEQLVLVAEVDLVLRPRWVMWSNETAAALVGAGIRVATSWDIAAVHRLIHGGWRASAAHAWAATHGLSPESLPTLVTPNLFTADVDDAAVDDPVDSAGHLRSDWVNGDWATTPERLVAWARAAAEVAALQRTSLATLDERPHAVATARSESAAELLCAELAADGLPMDRTEAEVVIAGFIGSRPRTEVEAAGQRAQRDDLVLRHVPAGSTFDLRSPGQVKSLLRRVGVEVPDTRAWRLEALRHDNPAVDALLTWRKAERFATTFGYAWLDEYVGVDGRIRGVWSGCDGAAGRMTATAGLHNMPAVLRQAVIAEPGHRFVRADLGQIEPRVLAAVSGDAALAAATIDDDLYLPVAERLNVDRPAAKVAVLGAMYGQTTGLGAHALRGLESAYPVAMEYLAAADRAGQVSEELRTYGGRLIRMGTTNANDVDDRDARSAAAARGRYGRNAMVQGAAAELFKVWAAIVRARGADIGARIVLCLHDELLVHVPADVAERCSGIVSDALQEAAHRWSPSPDVRFVVDVRVIDRWSDAKD